MIISEDSLPLELSIHAAVESAYAAEIARIETSIARALPVLVECDKELVPFLYRAIRDRLRNGQPVRQCAYLDGRPDPNAPPSPMPMGIVGTMVAQLRDAVRGNVENRVVVLPHLDLLVTSQGGLTTEAREVIPLLYENPDILWIGFKDPSFPLPETISNLFPHHEAILGVSRDRLQHLVTRREARKLGKSFDPYVLYKCVSGVNAVRLRRLLGSLSGEDYPDDPKPAFAQLRAATCGPTLTLPDVDLRKDIGGYATVKDRLQSEILDILKKKDSLTNADQIRAIESLIPRGMIFWGPPGTGKTLFAKAIATALGAAVTIVSGPELKSKWVGEAESNIRQIFMKARQSAPAIIVFDELDSFATARGTYTGSGVEHSMVNQLLTEMDGFRKDELVFVVGTTNFVESLDPALLRPGRFEFHLMVPYPDDDDRRAILGIYDKKLNLKMTEEAMNYAVKRSGEPVEGVAKAAAADNGGGRYSGDHLQALCRQLARHRLREGITGPTKVDDIERALSAYLERPELTASEENTIATHECGHAIVSMHCPKSPPIERISIRGDVGGALGFVKYADRQHKFVVTENELLDSICTLFGGREAEVQILGDASAGAGHDFMRATQIARALVEQLGLGGKDIGPAVHDARVPVADETRRAIDLRVSEILVEQQKRAHDIVAKHKKSLLALRAMLLEKKVLERSAFADLK